jgi:hypothetical protein
MRHFTYVAVGIGCGSIATFLFGLLVLPAATGGEWLAYGAISGGIGAIVTVPVFKRAAQRKRRALAVSSGTLAIAVGHASWSVMFAHGSILSVLETFCWSLFWAGWLTVPIGMAATATMWRWQMSPSNLAPAPGAPEPTTRP